MRAFAAWDSAEAPVMNMKLSPKERLNRVTEILAEGVLALLRSLPFAWAVSRVKVLEWVKAQVVAVETDACVRHAGRGTIP